VSGVHERPVGATVEWYTPAKVLTRLGRFDLDPACGDPRRCHVRASEHWATEGDTLPWYGRIWLNPPYGPAGVRFIDRMIAHDHGLMLLPARTETRAFQRAIKAADAVCFLRDRLWFERNDGFVGRSSFGSVLFSFGPYDADLTHLGWTV